MASSNGSDMNSVVPSRDPNAFPLNEGFKGPDDMPDLLFPWKLHDLLDDAETNDDIKQNVVSWNADGVSFAIHSDERFVEEVMPKFMEEQNWEDFTQSLSSWGFVRFTSGVQEGAFIHRLLVKGKRTLCKQMRIRGKAVSKNNCDKINSF